MDKVVPYLRWALYRLTLIGVLIRFREVKGQAFHKKPILLVFLVIIRGWPGGSVFTLK